MDYQRRLDISSLKQSENPIILELKVRFSLCGSALVSLEDSFSFIACLQNLDLTKRTMVHEGPLSWRVNKDKRIGTRELELQLVSD